MSIVSEPEQDKVYAWHLWWKTVGQPSNGLLHTPEPQPWEVLAFAFHPDKYDLGERGAVETARREAILKLLSGWSGGVQRSSPNKKKIRDQSSRAFHSGVART